MNVRDAEPLSTADAEIATAADRRRPGRAAVSPGLVPVLRGAVDPEAPAHPALPQPRRPGFTGEMLLGGAIGTTLFLAGACLRYAL